MPYRPGGETGSARMVRLSGVCLAGAMSFAITPQACLGKTALLVVGSTTLNASDLAIKKRLDYYYTTTVRDDGASTDTSKDVIVISSSVGVGTVGTKYRSAPKGVLLMKPALYPSMAMTASGADGTTSGTKIKIVNANHQASAGVKLNALATVYGSSQGVAWGTPSGSASKVAVTSDGNSAHATIFTYENGAALAGGITAPARRVGYFIAAANALTAQGWQLFDFAVDYADGNVPPVAAGSTSAITWASAITRLAPGCGDWTPTWAANGLIYTLYGDCNGVTGQLSPKRSMGLASINGGPGSNMVLADINTGPAGAPDIDLANGGLDDTGNGPTGKKPSGMLAVGNTLYAMVRNVNGSTGTQAQIRYSTNYTSANSVWNWAKWTFTEFGYPVFVQYGSDFAGGGAHVYVVAHDGPSAYVTADRFILMRLPVGEILNQAAWEFFSGTPTEPVWVSWANRANRKAIFTSKGRCFRSGMSFNAARGRYYWWQQLSGKSQPDTRFFGGFGVYSAPNPWGPWRSVYYNEKWDVGPGEKADFPTKWMSGADMYLLFSGDDYFAVRKGTIAAGF